MVGITSGASAPEELVQRLVAFFRDRGTEDVSEFEVMREDVRFMLPKTVRQAIAAREASARRALRRPRPGGCLDSRGQRVCDFRSPCLRTRRAPATQPR